MTISFVYYVRFFFFLEFLACEFAFYTLGQFGQMSFTLPSVLYQYQCIYFMIRGGSKADYDFNRLPLVSR
ncbi:hypothetical protein FPQ18DRAFT_272514, partial [Pyronema domesticum]